MNYTLNNIKEKYDFSAYDGLTSVLTGLSGVPYGLRHLHAANQGKSEFKYRLGHRSIAILQFIPLFGGLAAVLERIIVYMHDHFFKKNQKQPSEISSLKETLDSNSVPNKKIITNIDKIAQSVKVIPHGILQSKKINSEVDEKAFNAYLFSHPLLIPQNKALLENTVCLANCLSPTITYHQVPPAKAVLNQLMDDHHLYIPKKSKITSVPHWFDYIQPHHFYIDFAHSTSFGGAYRSYGCVQEERMFAEFRALAVLDFKTKNGIHPCVSSSTAEGHEHYPPLAKPSPFIIEGIYRQFDISNTPYGGKFQKATPETIIKGIVEVKNPVSVNIIGLAAIDWRNIKNPQYKLEDLVYHFEAAYLANEGAKIIVSQRGWKETVIHTAPWGCGAFLNSDKMITAIQYLAARTTGVDLIFHGVGNPMNPDYTQENIDQIITWISELLDKKHSVKQILTLLLNKNVTDRTWAPKQG